MKSLLDSNFRYKPSFATDVPRTFNRIRRARRAHDEQVKAKQDSANVRALRAKVSHG